MFLRGMALDIRTLLASFHILKCAFILLDITGHATIDVTGQMRTPAIPLVLRVPGRCCLIRHSAMFLLFILHLSEVPLVTSSLPAGVSLGERKTYKVACDMPFSCALPSTLPC